MTKKVKMAGFTLIEVLVVIAILTILSVVSISALESFARKSGHRAAAHVIHGALEEAYARTLSSDGDVAFGVHFETSQVVIFEGTTYTSGDSSNTERILPARTSITDISLGGGDDVLFTRLSGEASPTGTITVAVTDDTSKYHIITIHQTGLSEITN